MVSTFIILGPLYHFPKEFPSKRRLKNGQAANREKVLGTIKWNLGNLLSMAVTITQQFETLNHCFHVYDTGAPLLVSKIVTYQAGILGMEDVMGTNFRLTDNNYIKRIGRFEFVQNRKL